MNVFENIVIKKKTGKKQFALLIDPDKAVEQDLKSLCSKAVDCDTDFIFVGGSLLANGSLNRCVETIKLNCKIPIVLFPGNTLQIDKHADAILFLSLISGRNAELLIGKHVIAAPIIKDYNLECIPTGYMLVESGNLTSVQYMSNTRPLPHDKNDIAACTALAGEMLGLKLMYMDAGSGAQKPISEGMIDAVRKNVKAPLIIGGGISSPEKASQNCEAGADIIVVGNSIEKDHSLIAKIVKAVHAFTP